MGQEQNDNDDDYDVSGLGFDAAGAIAFRNLTVYLTPSSNLQLHDSMQLNQQLIYTVYVLLK